MDDAAIDTKLQSLNRRVGSIEQILPTLATKEDVRAAVAVLATKEELREAVALLTTKEELREAIAPLATKEEMRALYDELRRHMDMIGESLRSDIQMLAEYLASVIPKGNAS